ncbi:MULTISPECIES: Rne/Rng family ribonuclease [unclassified Thermoanaerobacterium]|uniref:Rne/Rng family ribonuclease n=1 Tax=unclassified Thermoanaerobacterium TaxID=2622527 RepID=UPI000A14F23D|nr:MULTISPECIES: Rne/Rng family ribonuclease [unclassified Thermoanaerobacterium]MDE4541536.1 Rne/Rng family ribonuclease [Thermoanaerobacterium sp. R66]ORX23477.1 ribonuclease G [Thermoanaerobacterium sp. PSU-2]
MKRILFDISDKFYQVAYLEDGLLIEYHVENSDKKSIVGNIYKGKVKNTIKGMQSAFIDIGIDKNAYLFVNDVKGIPESSSSITKYVKPGQDIIVQVLKDSIGLKNPRVTTNISLPGKYVVLMPDSDHVGISHRIEDEKKRMELINIAKRVKPDNVGIIIRTAAQHVGEEEFERDIADLCKLYEDILNKSKVAGSPGLIYEEENFITKYIRDLSSLMVDEIIVNDAEEYKRIFDYIKKEGLKISVKYEDGDLVGLYGIEKQVERLLSKKVWLKSGGFIIIDETEALTVIDVNTGKYTGKSSLQETILKTNIEAAKEIALQLRLRDIGGIIVVDFIDMDSDNDRQKLLKVFEESLKSDRSKCSVLGFTRLGLVEMTRKRVRSNVSEYLQEKCDCCKGTGCIVSSDMMQLRINRSIERILRNTNAKKITITSNRRVQNIIEKSNIIEKYMGKYGVEISTICNSKLDTDEFYVDYQL